MNDSQDGMPIITTVSQSAHRIFRCVGVEKDEVNSNEIQIINLGYGI